MNKRLPARQRGISLIWVAVGMAALSAAGMVALFSMRHERNYLAEGWSRLTGSQAATAVAQESRKAAGGAQRVLGEAGVLENDGVMRKCVIDGKTVISNTDCKRENRSSRTIEIHDNTGFVVPKPPPPPPQMQPAIPEARQRMIDQAAQ